MTTEKGKALTHESATEPAAPESVDVPAWILSRDGSIRETVKHFGRYEGYSRKRDFFVTSKRDLFDAAVARFRGEA